MSTTSLRCDADGPLCGMDVPDLGQLTDDQFGMLFTCKSHVLTPVCLCQLSAATSLFCSAGACTCAVGDPMPTTVGACVDTSVAAVGGRLSGDTDFETGVAIGFTNGGFQVTFDHDDAMIHSQAGDAVHTCLVELPQNCPPGDTRGKIYKTTNARTGESWTQANSSHGCGGA
jgi:hypothetical protein